MNPIQLSLYISLFERLFWVGVIGVISPVAFYKLISELKLINPTREGETTVQGRDRETSGTWSNGRQIEHL
jgi:hypothetical protein